MTYTILQFDGRDDAIKCLVCGHTSHHPKDVEQRYCGHCHAFHTDLEKRAPPALQRLMDEVRSGDPSGTAFDRAHNRHNR